MPPKRPRDEAGKGDSGRERKKARTQQARKIQVQPAATVQGASGSIDVEKFVQTRAFEISALEKGMKSAKKANAQRAFQSLPRHLRRRAASHNLRRLPLRFRPRALIEMASDKTKTPAHVKLRKLPHSKKLKVKQGRMAQLLRRHRPDWGDYKQDMLLARKTMNKPAWLETHLWHAKRMKMVTKWGCKLAETPTDKSFRPSYRAAKHGSILHDSSYTACIEVGALKEHSVAMLNALTNSEDISPSSVRFSKGTRECRTTFYEFGSFPPRLIGPVTIIWQCLPPRVVATRESDEEEDEEEPMLLVTCHPTIRDAVHDAIARSFDAIEVYRRSLSRYQLPGDRFTARTISHNVFELTGPKSGEAIARFLQLAAGSSAKKAAYLKRIGMCGPEGVGIGTVASFLVEDPRLRFPPKPFSQPTSATMPVAPDVSLAAFESRVHNLWNDNERYRLRYPTYTKQDLDKLNAAQNKSASKSNHETSKTNNQIPVILVHRQNGDLSGFALYVPAGWGMAFWMSLVHCCGRVGGLREMEQQSFEAGKLHFPNDWVATTAYQNALKEEIAEKSKYSASLPPAIRPNFDKLGTMYPFGPDWSAIVQLPAGTVEAAIPGKLIMKDGRSFEKLMPRLEVNERADIQRLCNMQNPPIHSLLSKLVPKLTLDVAIIAIRLNIKGAGAPDRGAVILPIDDIVWQDILDQLLRGEKTVLDRQYTPPAETIGFLTSAGLSLSLGRTTGLGAISLAAFGDLRTRDFRFFNELSRYKGLQHYAKAVFYKNPTSNFARLAFIDTDVEL